MFNGRKLQPRKFTFERRESSSRKGKYDKVKLKGFFRFGWSRTIPLDKQSGKGASLKFYLWFSRTTQFLAYIVNEVRKFSVILIIKQFKVK